jgi:hypothetical protein
MALRSPDKGLTNGDHYTCTGNSKYGSGDDSEYAQITDEQYFEVYGVYPSRDPVANYLQKENLLAHDRPSGAKKK